MSEVNEIKKVKASDTVDVNKENDDHDIKKTEAETGAKSNDSACNISGTTGDKDKRGSGRDLSLSLSEERKKGNKPVSVTVSPSPSPRRDIGGGYGGAGSVSAFGNKDRDGYKTFNKDRDNLSSSSNMRKSTSRTNGPVLKDGPGPGGNGSRLNNNPPYSSRFKRADERNNSGREARDKDKDLKRVEQQYSSRNKMQGQMSTNSFSSSDKRGKLFSAVH